MSRARSAWLAAALVVLPLAACGSGADDKAGAPAAKPADDTLASAISGAAGMTVVATALKSTGLGSVLDGAAPYTLLAPSDDAFGALGAAGTSLQQPENRAAMAEVLRDHILPGYVAVSDIDAALKVANGKPVKMTTMGHGVVSFAREGDDLFVTTADGARARIDGAALTATNGVVLPIDAVLRKPPAASQPS